MRNCKKCGELKSLTDFPKNKQSKDGHELSCKACKRLLQKEWEAVNQDRCKAARQRWASKYPDITMEFQGEGQEFIAGILPGDIQGDGDSGRISAPPRRRITSYRSERPLAYSDAYVGLR